MNPVAAEPAMPFGARFASAMPGPRMDGASGRAGMRNPAMPAQRLDVSMFGEREGLRSRAIKLAAVALLHAALAAWLLNAQVAEPELHTLIRLDVRTVEVPAPSVAEKAPVITDMPKPLPAARKPPPAAPKPIAPSSTHAPAPALLQSPSRAEANPSGFSVPVAPPSVSGADSLPSAAAGPAGMAGSKGPAGNTGTSAARFDADYLKNPAPAYPPMSRKRQEEGRVILEVKVTADGRAERVKVRQGSGYVRLDEAALDTVQHWRFVPARSGNEPVAATVLVPIEFRLDS